MTTPPTAKLSIDTTLADPADAALLALLYLPDADARRWQLEEFTWVPSAESLAALPWPLVPDSDEMTADGYASAGVTVPVTSTGPAAYYAGVTLTGCPAPVNPGSDLTYVSGQLGKVSIKVSRGRVSARLAIRRSIPRPGPFGPVYGVSAADVLAAFPTTTPADVDPAISAYDVRLVHP